MRFDIIHLQDCIAGMKDMPEGSADVAIVDPPYNLSKNKSGLKMEHGTAPEGFGGTWEITNEQWDTMTLPDYWSFTMVWLTEVKRIIKPTGSLWVHGTYHNIGIVNMAMQTAGIEILNEVIWYKRNSFPNLSTTRLTASHETILWAHTGNPTNRQYLFNYDTAKEIGGGKQMRSVWDIPNNKEQDELRHGKHPTQKPIRLSKRMLALSGKPDDIILVPFAGSGTECVAAAEMGMHYVGFETNNEYHQLSQKRISDIQPMLL